MSRLPIALKAPPRILVAVQRLMIRLARTPLRRLLEFGYLAVARLGAWHLTRGARGAAVYARGGPGDPDFWPGLSDLDLVLVLGGQPRAPGSDAARVRERWRRLEKRVPLAAAAFDWPRIYEQDELREFAASSAFTYGLDRAAAEQDARATYFGRRASLDAVRALERPGLYEPTAGWRRLSGPERRPPRRDRDRQEQRIAAWLELLYWWRWAARFCVFGLQLRAADLSAKLVAEPARIWLWLAHGERAGSREEALERALARLPEEEASFRFALDVRRRLPDSPEAPLRQALPPALRLSSRIAELIAAEVAEHGATQVRLVGERPADPAGDRLPLVDWRALVCPPASDESFALATGSPANPPDVAAAATRKASDSYTALRSDRLLLMPAVEFVRSRLRALKCPPVDPVVFAVLEGKDVAAFPEVRGWSAHDVASRAVAEHCARLAAPGVHENEATLTAARAALFSDSVARGDPELCLTAAAVAQRLAAAGAVPSAEPAAVSREAVLALPAYRDL